MLRHVAWQRSAVLHGSTATVVTMNLLDAMRYLAALAQHRHFGRAAEACHITQPALSNAVRALEQEFGVTIVRRSRQYEGLTPEGERVLASAHRMLHEREALRQDLCASVDRPGGPLVIACVPTAVPVAARLAASRRATLWCTPLPWATAAPAMPRVPLSPAPWPRHPPA